MRNDCRDVVHSGTDLGVANTLGRDDVAIFALTFERERFKFMLVEKVAGPDRYNEMCSIILLEY